MKRRPFFLLEVFIATALIGAFAFLSIRGAYQAIRKEREQLKGLEAAMKADVERMEGVAESWNQVESIKDEWTVIGRCTVKCKAGKDNAYKLTVKNLHPKAKEYHYVVRRE